MEVMARGHVESHVDKYCGYKLLDCPSETCDKKTRKKDLDSDGKCVHELLQCSHCEEEVMEQDYEVRHTLVTNTLCVCTNGILRDLGPSKQDLPAFRDDVSTLSGHDIAEGFRRSYRYLSRCYPFLHGVEIWMSR